MHEPPQPPDCPQKPPRCPSAALNPPAATIPLSLLLALQPLGDAELSAFPESVDFGGEVLGKEWGVEDQQGFVVLVGG